MKKINTIAKTTFIKNILTVLLIFFIAACSKAQEKISQDLPLSKTSPAYDTVESIDLYIARGQVVKNEYEHYIVKDNSLSAECGELKKTDTTKPSVFKKEKRVKRLSLEQNKNLLGLLQQLKDLHSANTGVYPPSEDAYTPNSAGISELIFVIDGQEYEVRTSFDAVVQQKTESLGSAKELLSKLREMTPMLCGKASFFGIK